ncbi:MAG: metallophosphoesterase [Gemmatimonadetes bacterium]|jgi:putative SbcD/Mre11-related phosphoesterase|nr:metallophosphoesterase [Gemmatimonadota bacterium]
MNPWIEVAPGLRVTGAGAAWLPAAGVAIVADVHVGYELAARRRGGYLPEVERGGAVGHRLASLATALGAARLIIAGDLRHSTRDVDALERAELGDLAAAVRRSVSLEVVLGNHDRGGALAGEAGAAAVRVGDVDVVHHPPASTPGRWTICGHLHPRVTMRDETGASARYPCALVGERTIVLPAFSDWAGGTEARRLLPALAPGPWRVLPMVRGLVADVGMVMERTSKE